MADALSTIASDNNSSSSIQIDLLDASPRGQGGLAGGWRSKKTNLPVEAGLHGFWREYRNTLATLGRMEGVDVEEVLTPYSPSILVSESGRVAVAPVLGKEVTAEDDVVNPTLSYSSLLQDLDWSDPASLLQNIANLLPPPLDVALLSEFNPESPLSIAGRISAIGLLAAWADFDQEDRESWQRYDTVSAETLMLSAAGISPSLYRELVTPLLHVLPMCPGYDCSAAAALSCFHVFALQSRGAFDVQWCRGTIAERIFDPWTKQLLATQNVHIRGSSKVTALSQQADNESGQDYYSVTINANETIQYDAVVFAVGGNAIKRLLPSCPVLDKFSVTPNFNKLRGVTCVAVRLFLQPHASITRGLQGGMYEATSLPPLLANAMKESPVVVCGPRIGQIPELAEAGFCIYDLQRLHDEFAVDNEGDIDDKKEPCAALEVDFFRADAIANLSNDQDVARLALRAVAAALEIPSEDLLSPNLLLDVSVIRARDAVSHFCVDSASSSPDVRLEKGLYFCGDWVDRTGHASWSTEKAVVTGRQAAKALAEDFGFKSDDIEIIPAAPDSAQLSTLRQAAKAIRGVLSPLGLNGIATSPLVIAKQLSGGRQL